MKQADDDLFAAWMDEDFGVATEALKKKVGKNTFGKKVSYGSKKKGAYAATKQFIHLLILLILMQVLVPSINVVYARHTDGRKSFTATLLGLMQMHGSRL